MSKCKTCKGTGDLVPERTKRGTLTGRHKPATPKNIKKYAIGGGCIGCCPDCDGSGKIEHQIDDSKYDIRTLSWNQYVELQLNLGVNDVRISDFVAELVVDTNRVKDVKYVSADIKTSIEDYLDIVSGN